jgi:hypothetical protein
LNLTDVAFASGTIQNLYMGEFIYGNSSSPSNFTVFAFFEQPPLSDSKQTNYLTCHLIHEMGQKLSVDEIKASMRQEVIVPEGYNELGTQLQYFVGAMEIFFGAESLIRLEMNKLLHLVGKHKKQFRDAIALDEWFAARFLFAIDRRVQLFLAQCKAASNRFEVNDKYLDFGDIIESILFGNFRMQLPPTFKKVVNTTFNVAGNKRTSDKEDRKGKKQKAKRPERSNEPLVPVKNTDQHEAFKMREGESWKKNFKTAHKESRPTWNGTKSTKMCIRYHILGKCFASCDGIESHVPKDNIPPEKVREMCAFIATCHGK